MDEFGLLDSSHTGFEDIMVTKDYPKDCFNPNDYFTSAGFFIYHHDLPNYECVKPQFILENEEKEKNRKGGRAKLGKDVKTTALVKWEPQFYLDIVRPDMKEVI